MGDSVVSAEDYALYAVQYLSVFETDGEIDAAKQNEILGQITDQARLEFVEYELAKTKGITLTAEEEKKAESNTDMFMNAFPDGFLKKYGISRDCVNRAMLREEYVSKLTDQAVSDMADEMYESVKESYADKNFYQVYYLLFPSIRYGADGQPMREDDGSYMTLTPEELEIEREQAEKCLQRARSGEKLEDLAVEYGIAAISGEQKGMSGSYAPAIEDAINGLKTGDISDIVETEAGMMIIRMDAENDETIREEALRYAAKDKAKESLSTLQQQWISQSGVDKVSMNEDAVKLDLKAMKADLTK
ncbi:MAG: peptidylprolyl isomerase [Lachnospiraceae bacterium]|nr:peptidylprolyl isomerase [Lachnospiraceae bacterium]